MKKPISMRTRCIQAIVEDNRCNPHIVDSNGWTPLVCLEKILEKESSRFTEEDVRDLNVMREVLMGAMSQLEEKRNPLFRMIDECDYEAVKRSLLGRSGDDDDDDQGEGEKLIQMIDEVDSKTSRSPLSYAINTFVTEVEQVAVFSSKSRDKETIIMLEHLKNIILSLLQAGAKIPTTESLKQQADNSEQTKDPYEEICVIFGEVLTESTGSSEEDRSTFFNPLLSFVREIALEYYSKGGEMTTKSISCLHNAARRGQLNLIQFWIEKLGVDPNVKGRQGLTALHFAARGGKVEIVKYLLDRDDIDVGILDDRGKTALDAATVNSKSDVILLLEQKS